jgi:NhaA family Na+:H+ antiporter
LRTRTFWSYIFGAGALSWYALYFGGFEPALALVPIVPFLPHATRDPGFFVDAPAQARDPLNRFELWVRHPAQIALLLFGIVNAGVPLRALDYGTWALPVAMLLMRPLGFLVAVKAGMALGLHLPGRIGWRELVVTSVVLTIGFTMALFFATSAMGAGPALSAIKIGALLSAGGAVLSLAAARSLRVAPAGR